MKLDDSFLKNKSGKYIKDGKTYIFHESCVGCKNPFIARETVSKNQKYCSKECRYKNFILTEKQRITCLSNFSSRKTLPFGESAFKSLYSLYKKQSEKRGLIFSLDIGLFRNLVSTKCFYCSCEPKSVFHPVGINGAFFYNGLDRVNNDIGYIIDNVVPCCPDCNRAKRIMTLDSFCNWIERVSSNLNKIKNWGVS